jgi:hypothetical protein
MPFVFFPAGAKLGYLWLNIRQCPFFYVFHTAGHFSEMKKVTFNNNEKKIPFQRLNGIFYIKKV